MNGASGVAQTRTTLSTDQLWEPIFQLDDVPMTTKSTEEPKGTGDGFGDEAWHVVLLVFGLLFVVGAALGAVALYLRSTKNPDAAAQSLLGGAGSSARQVLEGYADSPPPRVRPPARPTTAHRTPLRDWTFTTIA